MSSTNSDEPEGIDFRQALINLATECQNDDLLEYMYYFMQTKMKMVKNQEFLA